MEHKHLVYRRIVYMYFFPVLILLFTIVPIAEAGISGPIAKTDSGADRLVYYFDTRARQSYVQLANLSNSSLTVHMQLFIVNSSVLNCEEIDWFDTYSAKDVHTYDLSDIARNDENPLGVVIPPASYGFIVISLTSGTSNSLVGTMRIIDDAGYEYRANAAAPETTSPPTDGSLSGLVNFNNTNGNSFSELIGFTYVEINPDTVYSSLGVSAVFGGLVSPDHISIYDEFENEISCSPQVFACSDGNSNIAIDNSLPNTKGEPNRVCNTSIMNAGNNSGHLLMPFKEFVCTDPSAGDGSGNCILDAHFVGFIGLNNGTNSGSFDSWWEAGETP